MSLTIPAGVAPFIESSSFSTPIFDTIKGIADIRVWGLAWLVASLAAASAAIRGRWVAYVIANALTVGLCTAWLGAVSWAKFVNGETLTYTAIGLWLFPMAACAYAIATPTEVHAQLPEG